MSWKIKFFVAVAIAIALAILFFIPVGSLG